MNQNDLHNKTLGYAAENVAKRYYENLGWYIVSQNQTERGSELDLVFRKDSGNKAQILFVEVKSVETNNRDKLTPEDNFTKSKQKYFKRGIELYLAKNKLISDNLDIRIDLACVYYHSHKPKQEQWTIKIYENIILE